MNIFEKIDEKFKSGNSVGVSQTRIGIEEWEAVKEEYQKLLNQVSDMSHLAAYYKHQLDKNNE